MDIRCKYRRSVIGPFWETINVFVILSGMTYVSSLIFNTNALQTLPYVGLGIIAWYTISSIITESTGVFIANKDSIRSSSLRLELYVGRTIFRIFITFLHHFILYFIGLALLPIPLSADTLMVVVGFFFLLLNAFWVVPTIGLLCARFRDLEMIIRNLLQLTFFITPVFWNYNTFSAEKMHVVLFNPLFYFLEAIRAPLLGVQMPANSYLIMTCVTIAGYGLFAVVYRSMRRNLAFFI
jgi:ABC-type polysaccharide/polyol phosphate export permease